MNIQKLTPKNSPVDVPLVKKLLVRLMTRNELNVAKRMLDRVSVMKNLETLNMSPEAHLAATMQIMDMGVSKGKHPGFEAGLMFGVSLALSARSPNGQLMLTKMLRDIEQQQDDQEAEIGKIDEAPMPTATAFPDEETSNPPGETL